MTVDRYAFPADLVNDVMEKWQNRTVAMFRLPPLPGREQLQRLLEAAYLAAHETDEARPITFTICCTPVASTVRRVEQNDLVESWGFSLPRPYDIQELRRLAVTTDLDSAAIWVQFPGEPDGQLTIKGLLNLGRSWANARDGFAFHYESLPDALTIRVDGPGRLTVFQGQVILSTLSSGRIRSGQVALESLHGVHGLLEEGHQVFAERIQRPRHAPTAMAQDFEWSAYSNVLLAIINSIRIRGHGGALVFAGRTSRIAGPAGQSIQLKYGVASPNWHLADHYAALMAVRHGLADLQWTLEEDGDSALVANGEASVALARLRLAYTAVRDANHKLAETCNFIGHLAGADGAVVLRTDLALLGFGAEILLDQIAPSAVYEVSNTALYGGQELDGEQFGMRHRSAMRLCSIAPDVAIFVVSQDGEVNLVFNHMGRVCFRRNINTTNTSMTYR